MVASTSNIKSPSNMQMRALAAYYYHEDFIEVPTLAQVAAKFGVTPSAISSRIQRFKKSLTPDQLSRFNELRKMRTRKKPGLREVWR